MANNIVQFAQSSGSPFDSIKQLDSNGREFWSARALMDLVVYVKWQKFRAVLDIAQENLESNGDQASNHFLPVEVKSQGRPMIDYKLSRLACYHTVLACDSRDKPMVKQAKHYFAVKTREAETVIPIQNDRIRSLELENENLKLKHSLLDRTDLLKITAPGLAEAIICPGITIIEKVEHIDRTVVIDRSGFVISQLDGISITQVQKQFGFKSTQAAWTWLESIGYGKETEHWTKEMTAHETQKLTRSAMADLKAKFTKKQGDRQKLLGENY